MNALVFQQEKEQLLLAIARFFPEKVHSYAALLAEMHPKSIGARV